MQAEASIKAHGIMMSGPMGETERTGVMMSWVCIHSIELKDNKDLAFMVFTANSSAVKLSSA